MCGRFTLVDDSELQAEFPGVDFPKQFSPRFNIAPSQPVLALPNDGKNKADFFVWGLIPSWAKDAKIGNRLINARAETLAEKPAFRGPYKYKRCVILADGFFEWQAVPGTKSKVPHYVRMKNARPFALAGLWDEWPSPDGAVLRSCTIITTLPNELMAPIHNRMPAILSADAISQWLDPAPRGPDVLTPLLRPFAAHSMSAFPVSTLVNNPAFDRPECILPA